jgi:tetratricopeptide (TPR) repeat protein
MAAVQFFIFVAFSFLWVNPCLALAPHDYATLGLYDKALPALEEKWKQGDLTVRSDLAEAYYHLEEWGKAASILENNTVNEKEKHLLALAFHRLKRSDESLSLFQELTRTPAVDFDHAAILFEAGKWDQARLLLSELKDPFKEQAQLMLAKIHLEMEQYPEAEKILSSLQDIPEGLEKERLFILGDLSFRRKNYLQCISLLEQALPKRNRDLAPWADQMASLLGKAYLKYLETPTLCTEEKDRLLHEVENMHLKATSKHQKEIQVEMLMHLGDYAYLAKAWNYLANSTALLFLLWFKLKGL